MNSVVFTGGEEVGSEPFLHLSHKTFMDSEKSSSGRKRSFISLGGSLEEWHGAIRERSAQLYGHMLRESAGKLSDLNPGWGSFRHAEILLGHLARLIAWRAARAEAQVSLLPEDSEVPHTQLLMVRMKPAEKPQEAYELLLSDQISLFVEAFCLKQRFSYEPEIVFDFNEGKTANQSSLVLKHRLALAFSSALAPLTRRNKIFVAGSYLGRFREVILQLILFQTPLLSEIRKRDTTSGMESPVALKTELSTEFGNIEEFCSYLLWELSPLKTRMHSLDMKVHFSKLGWPVEPRLIFTSNNFEHDLDFVIYLATHIDRARYVVGQHGNNYGVNKLIEPIPELETADQFLSWGWKGNGILPFGQLKPQTSTAIRKSKGVVLILRDEMLSYTAADMSLLNHGYVERVVNLIRELVELHIPVAVKPHSSLSTIIGNFLATLSSEFKEVEILPGSLEFKKLLRSGYLPIFTFDSTGMLEIGTSGGLFFFYPGDGIGHVKPEFSSNYEALSFAGVMESEPRLAASKIQSLSEGIRPEAAREGIKKFLNGIANLPPSPVMGLAHVLRNGKISSDSESIS